jgi:hypothetical protein
MAKRSSPPKRAVKSTQAAKPKKAATKKKATKKASESDLAMLAEAESLIEQANAAVYQQSGRGFVSQIQFRAVDIPARLKTINWFANVGKPLQLDVTMPVEQVKSLAQAAKHLASLSWFNTMIDSQNQLTGYLHEHHLDRYREWNKINTKFQREVIVPLTKKHWEPFRKQHGLDAKCLVPIQMSVRMAFMENAYLDCKHGSFFNSELLRVYEAGHLPCRWKGRWPQGTLLVY